MPPSAKTPSRDGFAASLIGTLNPRRRWPLFTKQMEAVMRCQFCQQDVKNPCHNAQEIERRATSAIERCEKALKSLQSMESGGRH